MATHTSLVVIHREDERYVAECPEIGTVGQGYTIDQALAKLTQATELYLEEFPLPETNRQIIITTIDVTTRA